MIALALWRLTRELDRWARLGRTPLIWWRDDDARQPTPALDRLLALAGDRPLSLAIIPDGDLAALAARLARARNVTVSQHGVDHVNRRPAGQPPSEYPQGCGAGDMAARIGRARAAMAAADLAPRFYTPPWNQIEAPLAGALASLGFQGLSAWTGGAPTGALARIDADLDILRWRGQPRFKGGGRVLGRLRRLLAQRRRRGAYDHAIGLLTHHDAHDPQAWAFLEWLLAMGTDRFRWCSFEALADGAAEA